MVNVSAAAGGARGAAELQALVQQLGDLDGVQGGALAQVVRDAPQRQAVLDGRVVADAADEDRELALAFLGRHVAAVLALIDDDDAGRLAQDVAGLVLVQRAFELDVHRLGVTDEHGHPHAGGGELDLGVEDLLGLGHHLPLFLRVT